MRSRGVAVGPRAHMPSAVGMGLVALDLVIADEETPPSTYAGGTCGNVLTVLSFLGWRTAPVSRLAQDEAAEQIIADLRRWKVSTEFVTKRSDGSTPVIVQRIRRSAGGVPQHSFSWRCPSCGAYFPGYKPVLASVIEQTALRLKPSEVFFFDRVSRSALLMAQISRKRGGVVVFEPAGVGEPALFREAWSVAHIVKYAHERLAGLTEISLPTQVRSGVLLEIETAGAEGLRFRSQLPHAKSNGWVAVPSFGAPALKDTAGAGDWCTAGVLHMLARGGLVGFRAASATTIRRAMDYGQALAAWNCGFEGARGGMYHQNRAQFTAAVEDILTRSSRHTDTDKVLNQKRQAKYDLPDLCRACSGTSPAEANRRVRRRAAR